MVVDHASEAPAPPSGSEVDRRASPRQNCNREAFCRPLKIGIAKCWRVAVVQISREGVGVISGQRLQPGAAVTLDFTGLPAEFHRSRVARIVHARKLPHGGWYFGCSLASALTDAEIAALLSRMIEADN